MAIPSNQRYKKRSHFRARGHPAIGHLEYVLQSIVVELISETLWDLIAWVLMPGETRLSKIR
jgi:hypothetical protein